MPLKMTRLTSHLSTRLTDRIVLSNYAATLKSVLCTRVPYFITIPSRLFKIPYAFQSDFDKQYNNNNNNNTRYLYTKYRTYALCSVVLTTLKQYKK